MCDSLCFIAFVFSSLPLLGINILHNIQFELGMILLSFAIGAYSLYHGYKNTTILLSPSSYSVLELP